MLVNATSSHSIPSLAFSLDAWLRRTVDDSGSDSVVEVTGDFFDDSCLVVAGFGLPGLQDRVDHDSL